MGQKSVRMAGKLPILAKISSPSTTGIFPRKRLFSLLDSSRKFPLIFITSPPGSGKTTLVASYLENRKLPCSWYKLDEGDADIATFFYYMGVAAKNIAPKKRNSLPVFTPDYVHGVPVFSKRYFEIIFSMVTTPFVFVFDNYQDVSTNTEFHEMISHGISDIPDGITIIISSRSGPPRQFAQMQVNNKLKLIDWDEIRFTVEEVKELVRLNKMSTVTDETIRYLHKRTDGWVAGLVLMLESMKRENPDYHLPDKLSSGNLFDYFVSEIFQKVDKDVQKFLLKTVFLPVMTVPMVERLTGIKTSGEILHTLSKTHYFTDTYSHDTSVYHYHPLFGEFLLSKAKESFPPNELYQIKKDAAALLEEDGKTEDAISLLLDCSDFEGLSRIIMKQAPVFISQGRHQTLLRLIDFFPKDFLPDKPWLIYYLGICKLPYNPSESLINFEVAFHQFRKQKDVDGVFLTWSGIVDSIMYGHEGLQQLDRWFPVIEDLMKEFKGFPSEKIESKVTCSMVRALSLRRPVDFDMKKWVVRIETFAHENKDISIKIRALTNLACYFYSEGSFQKLEIVLESLRELLQRHDVPPMTRLNVDWVKAAYFNMMSRYDECQKVVSDGLELAHMLKINIMEGMLLGHGVLSSLKRGDFANAQDYLHRMSSLQSISKPWEASFYHYCSAWEALYRNNLARALTHSEHCLRFCENTGNPWTLSCAHLLTAYASFAFGENKKAAEYIKQALSIGIKTKNEFTPFICLLTEAYFNLKQGKEKSALEAIRKGLKIGREKGFVNLFMCQKGVMETVLTKALEYGIEVPYVKDLIHRNAILPDISSVEIESWPWPLKIFTLGRLGIVNDGKVIQFSGKVQQKPLSLLKVLIASGGREVPEERIVDILWPEAEGDAAHSAFTTTLFRLRQLLRIEQAIKFHEGKAYLNPRYCWVDAWAFERLLGKVDGEWERGLRHENGKQVINQTEKALRMYTGPFLAGDHEPWMLSIRERLRNKYLRNVKRLGQYWEQNGKLDKAVECYQKGLEVDDLTEEFYQSIMKCYQKMGKRAEALTVYKRCYQMLSSVLGIEPSPETEAIHKALYPNNLR